MNILLWLLQSLLAFWYLVGGSFMMAHYQDLQSDWAKGLPNPVWITYGVLEVLFAVGLLWPKFTRFAAAGLASLALLGCALFAKFTGFPGCFWGVVPAILLTFVAYGRFRLKPF